MNMNSNFSMSPPKFVYVSQFQIRNSQYIVIFVCVRTFDGCVATMEMIAICITFSYRCHSITYNRRTSVYFWCTHMRIACPPYIGARTVGIIAYCDAACARTSGSLVNVYAHSQLNQQNSCIIILYIWFHSFTNRLIPVRRCVFINKIVWTIEK